MQRTIAVTAVPIILLVAFALIVLKATRREPLPTSGSNPPVRQVDAQEPSENDGSLAMKSPDNQRAEKQKTEPDNLSKKFARLLADEVERKSGGKTRLDKEISPTENGVEPLKKAPAADLPPADRLQNTSDAPSSFAPPVESPDKSPLVGIQTQMVSSPGDLAELNLDDMIGKLVITGDRFDNRSLRDLKGGQILSLSIEAVNITNIGLHHLTSVRQLRELRIWAPDVDDAGLPILAEVQSLEWLDLEGTNVSGVGLKSLAALPRLRRLTLGPRLQEQALQHLQAFPSLNELDLRSCRLLSDACVTFLKDVENLQVLWLPSQVTADGRKAIREALPQCQVRL
jgi:hypothetical protein